ncbi:uncharacterized protein LOC118648500 [Monomorium pharaonis]|uniref:uncharacterized protein LOC118648500 n=1 Tax=Monomorium pharaonis TaxID=307658 RepID=UPI0017471D16|nr:uncharacterized protein LOC118648500 [Monomorium pharaonis]
MATWTKEAVQILIDAYKNEPCLYQTRNPNYHNKNLRNEALERICAIVSTVKPNITGKECSSENVYKPNLWYYDALKFLEEHIVPRKSKNSHLPNSTKDTPGFLLHHDYVQTSQDLEELQEMLVEDNNVYVHEEDLNNNNEESQSCASSSSDNIIATTPSILKQKKMQSRSLPFTDLFNINTSSPSTSCSVQSSPNVGNALQSSSTTHNPKKQKIKNGDAYVEAVESIAQSLKMPLTPVTPVNVATDSTDPVDTCMNFLDPLLKIYELQISN